MDDKDWTRPDERAFIRDLERQIAPAPWKFSTVDYGTVEELPEEMPEAIARRDSSTGPFTFTEQAGDAMVRWADGVEG